MKTASTSASLDHDIGSAGLLSIRLANGRARLRAADGTTVRIRDNHGRELSDMFDVEFGDGSVSLRADKGGNWHGGGHTPDLEIDVPRAATVVVEGGSADIEADGLVGDQRYRTASGDMSLRAVSGRIAIDAVSGDVDISATGEAAVTIKTVSGDVELRAATLTTLDATTTSGDLRVAGRLSGPGPFAIVTVSGDTLLAPAGDLRVEMATLSGDLRSKAGGQTEGGRGRRSLTLGSGAPLLTLRSLSGDLLVVPPTPVRLPDPGRQAPVAIEEGPRSETRPEPPTPAPVDAPNPAIAAAYDDARLRILRSLERGEIDVAEAGQRLEALDGVDPVSDSETPVSAAIDDVDPGTETARFDPNATTDA
jgi:hypothetical protein